MKKYVLPFTSVSGPVGTRVDRSAWLLLGTGSKPMFSTGCSGRWQLFVQIHQSSAVWQWKASHWASLQNSSRDGYKSTAVSGWQALVWCAWCCYSWGDNLSHFNDFCLLKSLSGSCLSGRGHGCQKAQLFNRPLGVVCCLLGNRMFYPVSSPTHGLSPLQVAL